MVTGRSEEGATRPEEVSGTIKEKRKKRPLTIKQEENAEPRKTRRGCKLTRTGAGRRRAGAGRQAEPHMKGSRDRRASPC